MAERKILTLQDLQMCLASARSELSAPVARAALRQIVSDAQHVDRSVGEADEAATVASAALADLAAMEGDADARLALRRQAIEVCRRRAHSGGASSRVAISFANRIVDHFYDMYAHEDRPTMVSALAQVSQMLGGIVATAELPAHDRAQALSQRSSLIRCQAMITPRETRATRIAEAIRCAELATTECPADPFAHLELGQALWASARWASSDEDCYRALQRAEDSIVRACQSGGAVALLVLARFYRLSYRPAQAVSVFRDYMLKDYAHRRRGLSESFVLGEAAVQMWFNGYPEETTKAALDSAFALLSEAAGAGYENARIFCALAFTQAALGRRESSDLTLQRLSIEPVSSWVEIVSRAETALDGRDRAPLRTAFSLGVADASVWNALGTFAARFMEDDDVALRLYEIAKRLRPTDPVILTNIARVYLRRGTVGDLARADDVLDLAAAHAPRTFLWWRAIRSEVALARGSAPAAPKRGPVGRSETTKIQFRDVQRRFRVLKAGVENDSTNPQQRGYLLESIVADTLAISYQAVGSHQYRGRQVDAAFFDQDKYYRVEVKWQKEPLDQSDLDGLEARLKQAEVRGIVISMSGYRSTAVESARRMGEHHAVILMDGEEWDAIMDGKLRFETLLDRKVVEWSRSGDPYYRSESDTTET